MIRTLSPNKIFLTFGFVLLVSVVAFGQNEPPPDARPQPGGPPPQDRPNLMRALDLSPDQVRQMRELNQEQRPAMEAAGRRLREANRFLDEAIYADTVSDADFETRLKEFQAAQAEMARLRFASELKVRKILTPAQLIRFRELRRRFGDGRMGQPRPGGPPPGVNVQPFRQQRPPAQKRPI